MRKTWSRARAGSVGVDNWSYNIGTTQYVTELNAPFLNDPQTVVRTLVDFHLSITYPTAALALIAEPIGIGTAFGVAVAVTNSTHTFWPNAFTSNPTTDGVVATGLLYPTFQVPAAHTPGITQHYSLKETLDSQGARHVPATDGQALVTITLTIQADGGIMGTHKSVVWQSMCYARALFEESV